jgi:hypothetical protein
MKKTQTVWWRVTFTNDITDEINPTVKYISKFADEKLFLVYTEGIKEGNIVRYKKGKLYGDATFLPIELLIE